jgi:hypothetical protein
MTEPDCDVAGGHDVAILEPYEIAIDSLTAFGLIAVSAMLSGI